MKKSFPRPWCNYYSRSMRKDTSEGFVSWGLWLQGQTHQPPYHQQRASHQSLHDNTKPCILILTVTAATAVSYHQYIATSKYSHIIFISHIVPCTRFMHLLSNRIQGLPSHFPFRIQGPWSTIKHYKSCRFSTNNEHLNNQTLSLDVWLAVAKFQT